MNALYTTASRLKSHQSARTLKSRGDSCATNSCNELQKITLSWNSIARGAPIAFTPDPRPVRKKLPFTPCSIDAVVPLGEPGGPFRMLLKGDDGPSKLEKLKTLK